MTRIVGRVGLGRMISFSSPGNAEWMAVLPTDGARSAGERGRAAEELYGNGMMEKVTRG